MDFQSVAGSPMSRQMDSMAILIILGGLVRVLISTRCCLFIDFTAAGDHMDSKTGSSDTKQLYRFVYSGISTLGLVLLALKFTCYINPPPPPPPHTHTHTHTHTHLAEPV